MGEPVAALLAARLHALREQVEAQTDALTHRRVDWDLQGAGPNVWLIHDLICDQINDDLSIGRREDDGFR